MQGINRVLLENLMPAHVARHFLTVLKVIMAFAKYNTFATNYFHFDCLTFQHSIIFGQG